MKLRVFLRAFGIPLVLTAILLLRLQEGLTTFKAFGSTVFVVSVTLAGLLTDKRYLQTITVHHDSITISYLTQFLQQRTMDLKRSSIFEVKLSKRRWYTMLWPPVLDIKVEGEWMPFGVLSKETYDRIGEQLLLGAIAVVK